jgi:hypothetical protein
VHRRRALTALAALLLAACGAGEERVATDTARAIDPRCDGRELPPVGPAGIGPAQLGVRIAVLAQLCAVTDSQLVIAEGMRERGHIVRFGEHEVLAISTGTPDSSIVRLIVRDSAFRTPQGLGVGSTIGEMRSFYPVLAYSAAEQRVVSIPSYPGISFAYEGSGFPTDPARASVSDPAVMDAARITSFWIFRPVAP